MADVTQAALTLLAHAALTHPGSKISDAAQSVVGDIGMQVYLNHASIEATANATGVSYMMELTHDATNDEHWFTVDEVVTGVAAPVTEALTATEPIGETVLACASTTGFSNLDQIYVQDAGTLADSEWHVVDLVTTNTSITILYGLTTQKDSADAMWTEAEKHTIYVDLTGVNRVRMSVIHRAATGSDIHFRCDAVRYTDFE